MRKTIGLFVPLLTWAGLMDFQTLSEARHAYETGDFDKATALYGSIQDKNEAARYNYADALYKSQQYQKALNEFRAIEDPSLKPKALHNAGNSLAQMKKIDEAIKAYEEALKFEEDADTRHNLELLQKMKEQQQKQNQNDQKNDQNDKKNHNDQQSKDGQNNQKDQRKDGKKDQQKSDQHKQNEQKNEKGEKGEEEHQEGAQQSSDARKEPSPAEAKEHQEREKQEQAAAENPDPISDMQERKYMQMLQKNAKQRGVNTLMVPLQSKGGKRETQSNPW